MASDFDASISPSGIVASAPRNTSTEYALEMMLIANTPIRNG